MKALEILKYQRKNFRKFDRHISVWDEAIAELESITSRVCCENCQQYDAEVQVCYQNGCNDYEDWELWKPKESK